MKKNYLSAIIILFAFFILFSFPSLALIPGDFNEDGCVEFEDLMIFALAYGTCEGDDNWDLRCDIYGDGCIEFEDLMLFAMHYGEGCGSCTPPSPPTLSDPGTTLPSPATYTVSWSSISGATYILQEATSPDFSGAISYPLPGTSKEFSHTVSTTTTYYYRVAAVDDCGQSSWSNVEDILIDIPHGNYDYYNLYQEAELEGDYVVRDGYKIKVVTVYSDGRVIYEINDSVNVTLDPGQFYDDYDGGKLIIYHEFGDTDVNKVASWQTWTVNLNQKTITPDNLQVTQGQQDAFYTIQTPGNEPYNIKPAKVTPDGEYISNNWSDSWTSENIDSTHWKALIDIPNDAPVKTYDFWLKYMHSGTGDWLVQKVQLTVNNGEIYKPTVTTESATIVDPHSAIANGTITSDGGSNIIERGFEYGLTQTPTWSVKETGTDLGTGAFSNTISGLNSDTTYWVKAYAINNEGKSTNDDWKEFHTPPDDITITNEATFTCDEQQPVMSDYTITVSF